MKPTTPEQNNFGELATAPCRAAYLLLVSGACVMLAGGNPRSNRPVRRDSKAASDRRIANDAAMMSSTRIQGRKRGGYRIHPTLDRIGVGLATAHRWQMIAKRRWEIVAKPLGVLLLRAASQTKMTFSHCYRSLESFLKAKWHIFRPPALPTVSTHVYEIRPRADKHGVDLISDALPFGSLWYSGANATSNAIGFVKFSSHSHNAVIRVYDDVGNVIETHEQKADLKEL